MKRVFLFLEQSHKQKIIFSALFVVLLLPSIGVCNQQGIAQDTSKINDTRADTTAVNFLNGLAFSNYYRSPDISLKYAFKSLHLSDSLKYIKGYAEAYRQIGLGYWALADMPSSLHYFFKGLEVAQANNLQQAEADILGNIGMAYNGMKSPTEALKFLSDSRAKQKRLKNLVREASVLNNIGDSYLAMNNYDQAMIAYRTALKISLEKNYRIGIATNTRNIGNIFEAHQVYDSALRYYSQSLKFAQSIKDNRGIILSNKSIASVYLKINRLDLSKEYAHVALNAAKSANLRAFIRDTYQLLNSISELEGKFSEAHQYLKLYSLYQDSVQNLRVASEINALRISYENHKKQNEIDVLVKDAALQNQIFIATGAILVLFVILFVVSIRSYSSQKKLNKILSEKTIEIETQRDTLGAKNNELADANKKIQASQMQLIQSEKMASLGVLTAGIAHEINNPVNFISVGIAALERKLNQLDFSIKGLIVNETSNHEINQAQEKINQLIQDIKIGTSRTEEIVSSLRTFSHLDKAELKVYDINEGIESTLVLLNSRLKDRIEIVKHIDADVPHILCYPGQLNQVFMNILSNATDAIKETGAITITSHKIGDYVEVCIADTGKGIPQALREKIFEPFFTTKDVGVGTGLGLSISYSIIQEHKGTISVISEEGVGTQLTIRLPIRLQDFKNLPAN